MAITIYTTLHFNLYYFKCNFVAIKINLFLPFKIIIIDVVNVINVADASNVVKVVTF